MRKVLFIGLMALSITTFASTPSSKSLQKALNQIRDNHLASAASLSIKIGNQPIQNFSSGSLSFKHKTPVNAETLYQFGSITKSFVAALMLKLQTQGLIKLNESVTRVFPQYVKWKKVAIKNLLDHTSGIFNFTESRRFDTYLHSHIDHQYTAKDLIAIGYRNPLAFEPGEGYLYSNTDYILAGAILEKLTDRSVKDLLQNQIFNPLHLNSIYYIPGEYPDNILARTPNGYSASGRNVTDMNMSWLGSAGSVIATTHDITQWAYDLFNGNILTTSEFKEMTSGVSELSGRPSNEISARINGLGIQRKYIGGSVGVVWYHPGGTTGFASMMIWIPKKHVAFSIAVNREINSVMGIESLADPIISLFQASSANNKKPGKLVYPLNVSQGQ